MRWMSATWTFRENLSTDYADYTDKAEYPHAYAMILASSRIISNLCNLRNLWMTLFASPHVNLITPREPQHILLPLGFEHSHVWIAEDAAQC